MGLTVSERRPRRQRVTVHVSSIGKSADNTQDTNHWRPQTRAECIDGPRPCPYVGCKYHLFLDFTPLGSLKFNFGDADDALESMQESCSLDVADRGGQDMTKISQYINVTPARVQQEVAQALIKMKGTTMSHHDDPEDD